MKKSELRQIIQEEIKAVLEAEGEFEKATEKFSQRILKDKPVGGGNVEGLPLEKLEKYKNLPDTYDPKSRVELRVPTIDNADASQIIKSKDEANKWKEKFIAKWGFDGNDLKFKKTEIGYEVINSPKYAAWKIQGLKDMQADYEKYRGRYSGD